MTDRELSCVMARNQRKESEKRIREKNQRKGEGITMPKDTKNFRVSEFTCKCGCGLNNLEQGLIDMCQKLRDKLGVPVRVNSGCRCVKHNANVGGVRNSQHLKGVAADLSCELGAHKMYETVKAMYESGELNELRFCKEYKTWIHIDCGRKRNNIFEGMKR